MEETNNITEEEIEKQLEEYENYKNENNEKCIKDYKGLEWSDFNTYPHYVFATAFLVDGKLADYKIQNRERCWENRTFRGSQWENEVWEHGFRKKDWKLTCEYKKILVNNNDEHNKAFEDLEDWLFNNFEIYEKISLTRWR